MQNLSDKNLYYVGGVVRDEILGCKNFDTDLCYEGNAIEYARTKGLHIMKENPAFGTVRVLSEGAELDIASTREEEYPRAGHLPEVKNIGCSLERDLKRRDFTINAMAKDTVNGKIIDYFGGLEDINNKKLRVLHNKSFIDDPTRIVRGLKFSVRFGFELEENTKYLQKEYLDCINYDMSYHRLKKELAETFNLNIGEAYDKCIEQKIYELISSGCNPCRISGKLIEAAVNESGIKKPWIIYLGMITLNETQLPLTRQEKKIITWAKRLEKEPFNNNTPCESIVINKLRSMGK